MDNEFFANYVKFVNSVTSDQSKQYTAFEKSLYTMKTEHLVPPERLLTATLGLSAEAGEFGDLVKKCIFQGKELNEENKLHMKKELGDIMWYMAQACLALGVTLDDVIKTNIEKLEKRYPNGFEKIRSENKERFDV
jgi:NTP pyrophosphatase (non-canonical NTP hydrolase)